MEHKQVDRNSVIETHNNRTERFIALCVVLVVLITGCLFAFWSVAYAVPSQTNSTFVQQYIPETFRVMTPAKQFVIAVMSGMIVFPIPVEASYYLGIRQGNPVLLSTVAVIIGFILGNVVTYIIGRTLSKHIVFLLSTKQMYSLRRKVAKYGVYAILIVNLLPAPSDLLTFALGMTRYNVKRLFIALSIAVAIKFAVYGYLITAFN